MSFSEVFAPLLQGFFLGASLIIAIGAQNAFVLRLGLQRQHVLPVVLVCAFSDALLIAAGVAGMGALVQQSPILLTIITWAGFAFLMGYGLQAFRRALKSEELQVGSGGAVSLKRAILTVLAFTYLNPHVYLDTVLLVGSLSAQWPRAQQGVFAIGAILASFVWFFALGYGARILTPLFEKPIAWRILDFTIGAVMWLLALSLLGNVL
ncbi:L-lysine exporter family protein LysE/ArgO [Cohaesibacter sp. ES.047]|uniref:LysE/ArgO family amino acid transporter n=1 Tax=Cohaesibacter sp. ES.047 TaxID=1798205 RepID=UPI000BB8A9F8|nr:LysE/ArgO family amino acid transporter [Cohaesibacter sp. ES.047]SNY92554.1 L-lysine exporter family protein LysE/ArgO [Cohaesibacter sp. ES.047]